MLVRHDQKNAEIAELLRLFLEQHKEKTRQAYDASLSEFAAFAGIPVVSRLPVWLIDEGGRGVNLKLGAWKMHLKTKNAPNTVNRKLAALRSLLRWLRALDLISWTVEIKSLAAQNVRRTEGPGVEALGRVLGFLQKKKNNLALPYPKRREACQLGTWLRLTFDLGLRAGETLLLSVRDVDLPRRQIWVVRKGGEAAQRLGLTPLAVESLREWLDVWRGGPKKPSDPVFVSSTGRRWSHDHLVGLLTTVCKQAKVQRFSSHGIRHTAITEAIKQEPDLTKVQKFSGHKKLETLLLYRDQLEQEQQQMACRVSSRLYGEE